MGAAFELLHTALIVHDDVIDNDFVRRGAPNISGSYRDRARAAGASESDAEHRGISAAVIAGDLALFNAYRLIDRSGVGDETRERLLEVMDDALFASPEVLEKNAKAVDALVESMLQTMREISARPEVAAELRAKYKLLPDLPKQLEEVAAEVGDPPKAVISILAAVSTDRLAAAYPGASIYRFIPSMPTEVRRGPVTSTTPGT